MGSPNSIINDSHPTLPIINLFPQNSLRRNPRPRPRSLQWFAGSAMIQPPTFNLPSAGISHFLMRGNSAGGSMELSIYC